MKNKIFVLGFMVLFSAFSLRGNAQTKMTLQQCIETGLANNLEVLQSQLLMQSDEINMKQAKLNLLPDLNGSANQNFSQGRSIDPYSNSPVTQAVTSSNFSLSSGVILFNGLALQNNIKQNSLAYQAAKMDWQQVKDNLTINIILAYLQVLSSEDQLTQANYQVTLSQKQVERLQLQDKEGAIKPSDLSDLKGQYAGDQLSIINTQNTLQIAKLSLCQLMNIPYSKDILLERINLDSLATNYENTPDKIYQTALQQLAFIKAVDLKKESAEKGLKVAKGQLFPTLRFGGNVTTNYSSLARQNQFINTDYAATSDSAIVNNVKYPVYRFQDNFTPLSRIGYKDQLNNNIYTSYGFSLNIPIFNALQQRNRVKLAKITLKNRELVAKTARTQLSQSIDQAYINMLSASGRNTTLQEQVNAYKESFHAAEIRFNEGVGNSIDYLTAKNNLDRANTNLINARYDFVLRMKILDYYEGKPLW